jgi:hypothetical protein
MPGHDTQSTDEMMRIDQMNHCHKDTVILLDLNVIDIMIEVVIKGQTYVPCLFISLTVFVSGFILVLYIFNQSGEGP